MKVTVAEGIQCVHDGTVYESGETADVPKALAQSWIRSGWAEEVDEAEEEEPRVEQRSSAAKAAAKRTPPAKR